MREKEAAVISRVRLPTLTTVDGTWEMATDAIRQAAQSKLAISKSGQRKVDKQTANGWRKDLEPRKAAKKAVAVAKVTHYGDVNEKLESRNGHRYLYRFAKNRHRQTENNEKIFGIIDENNGDLHSRISPSSHSFNGSNPRPVQKITVEERESGSEEDEARQTDWA
ncbi:unnamed protein product [Heligmosomoides polygyrus]|uniref:Transposase, Ptta/En/Spm, plant n=1 Tax=Heligmosomoides polygyrus TaxID=6339 RepID=A0A183GIZ4_HELPZ|nr:unnamed protein product [Heligmosomoides polygyrus]